jgi:prefoldin subunit 5
MPAKGASSAQVTLDPTWGYHDTQIHVRGTNFTANEEIIITWEGLTFWKLYVSTNGLGIFDTYFSVPDGLEVGGYAIRAADKHGNTAAATFTLYSVYVNAGALGIKSAKQNVEWKYDSDEFYCYTWSFFHNAYGGQYNLLSQDYGLYILRLTYGGKTYVFDLAGGKFNNWPQPLVERVGTFTVVDLNRIRGTISVYDTYGTTLLATVIVNIQAPISPENYYYITFTLTAEARLDDLAFYSSYNIDDFVNNPNWACYEGSMDMVYTYYGPTQHETGIPDQYKSYAGFSSVTSASTHHDVAVYYSDLQYLAGMFKEYDFNYRDRDEAYSDSTGDCGVALQWSIGLMNQGSSVTIPLAFAASGTTLGSLKINMEKSKLLAYTALSQAPALTLSASQAPGSAIVTATGSGYMPYAQVNLSFGGVMIASSRVSGDGSFVGSFIVPTSVTGAYDVTAKDSYGLEAAASFQVVELTLQWVLEQFNQLNATVTGVVQDVDGSLSVLISTSSGNIMAKLDEIDATLAELSSDSNGEILATINTTLGTITTRLTEIDAHMVALVTDAKEGILARIESKAGDMLVRLDTLNASIAGLVTDLGGNINLLINTACGNVIAKMTEVNASIQGMVVSGKGEILANIGTAFGNVTTTMQSIYAQLEFVNATTLQINSQVGKINVTVNSLNSFLEQVNATVAKVENKTGEAYLALSADLGEIKVKLDFLNATLLGVKGGVAEINVTVGKTTSTVFAELNAIKANLTEIEGTVATINTSIGTITTSIDNIDSEIVAFSGDLVAVKTSIGELQVGLDSLDGKITLLNGDLAAVQTSVGTIVGNVTSIHEGIIEIETKLGSLTASTSLIQSGTNWQVLAIVLIEIAAISVVIFQTKMRRKKPSLQPPKARDVTVD